MSWPRRILLAALGLTLCAPLAAAPAPLDALHQHFAAHDRRIADERASWQAPYQQALALAQSAEPLQALPAFEALLENLAEQEIPFSRVYARYFTLTEQLAIRPRAATFLQELATRHPTPWVQGARIETQAQVDSRALVAALFKRLQARHDQAELSSDLQTLYRLIWPYTAPGEAEQKAAMADELAEALGADFDRRGVDQLARWRYQRTPNASPPDPALWQSALEQALASGQYPDTIAALSHYLAALIASNRLEDGAHWARARLAAHDANPALPLIIDLLDTAHANQRLIEQALAALPALRQNAPDSLLLALAESSLRYHALTQGYTQADAVLTAFGQRQPHDARIQHAIGYHREMLANWAKLPGRAKRNTLPAVRVTAGRIGGGSTFSDIGMGGGNSISRAQNGLGPTGGCGSPARVAQPAPTPVVRLIPRLPPPPKVKPAPRADSAATAPQLGKQLASEAQLAELRASGGTKMAGPGMRRGVDDAPRLIAQYGGRTADWFKVSSQSYRAADGTQFEIHAYWNAVTKQLVEPKSIVIRTP